MPSVAAICCPVDFSEHSRVTLGYALRVAQRERVPVTVVHAIDPLFVQAAAIADEHSTPQRDAHEELTAFVKQITDAMPGDPPTFDVRITIGEASAEILEAAGYGDGTWIIMGTHGLGGVKKLFFGSTTARVLRRMRTPVVTVPPLQPDDPTPHWLTAAPTELIAAVDVDDVAITSIQAASDLAVRWNCRLTLLHIVPELGVVDRWRGMLMAYEMKYTQDAQKALDDLTEGPRKAGVQTDVVIRSGTPEEVIPVVARQQGADVILMGLRSSKGLFGPQPGSTAYRVLSGSPTPVLVLPGPIVEAD